MSIKYAVLALIVEKPRHGYAVRNAFEARLSDIREIGFGQVYQVLAGLEKDGFVRGAPSSQRLRRIVYTATRRGRSALRGWLLGAGQARAGFQDDIFLRLLFASPDQAEGMIGFLSGQILQVKDDLKILRTQHQSLASEDDPALRMRSVYIQAEILHREADFAAIDVALREIDRLWPQTGRRRVGVAKPGPARETSSISEENRLRNRSPASTKHDHRWKSRCG